MSEHVHEHAHHDHDHGHAHGHAHAHGHGHAHAHLDRTGRAFAIGVGVNALFVAVEVTAGVFAKSVALLSDAAHNFGDVVGLLLAWGAMQLAQRKPSRRHTYGLRRSTILASLANAILLLVSVGGVGWEAVRRLRVGEEPQGLVMLVVAAIGVVINTGAALLFVAGRKEDANVRGAFLHLAADAAVSLGVVVAGGLILLTGWSWLDAATSLVISLVILASTWSLLKDATNLALDAVPEGIDPDAVRAWLAKLPGVQEVHDLHIWAMSTTETALTAHLVMAADGCHPRFLHDVSKRLEAEFRIHHATLQVEPPDAPDPCAHAPDEAV